MSYSQFSSLSVCCFSGCLVRTRFHIPTNAETETDACTYNPNPKGNHNTTAVVPSEVRISDGILPNPMSTLPVIFSSFYLVSSEILHAFAIGTSVCDVLGAAEATCSDKSARVNSPFKHIPVNPPLFRMQLLQFLLALIFLTSAYAIPDSPVDASGGAGGTHTGNLWALLWAL